MKPDKDRILNGVTVIGIIMVCLFMGIGMSHPREGGGKEAGKVKVPEYVVDKAKLMVEFIESMGLVIDVDENPNSSQAVK